MKGANAQNLPANEDTSFKVRLPLSAAIIITVLFAASLAVGLSYAGYYFLLRPSTRLSAVSYRDLVEVVKIAFTVVAGIGGAIALTVAVRKQRFAERQHKLSEVDADRQDRQILDERFRNAVMQLGEKESAAVRIGGAYALAKLADDWSVERQTCINVLCGYLRVLYDHQTIMASGKFGGLLLALSVSTSSGAPRLAGTGFIRPSRRSSRPS